MNININIKLRNLILIILIFGVAFFLIGGTIMLLVGFEYPVTVSDGNPFGLVPGSSEGLNSMLSY